MSGARRTKTMLFTLLLVVGWDLTGTPAGAHSDLESTTPATGSVVTEAVEVFELVFASSIRPDSAEVAVVVDGRPVEASARGGSSDRVLLIKPEQPIGGGEVGVAARVLAIDGHAIEVGIGFSVDAPARGGTRRPRHRTAPRRWRLVDGSPGVVGELLVESSLGDRVLPGAEATGDIEDCAGGVAGDR